ncbi:Ig-like domain-containing protein, partial [Arthrobacter deserti]|nr:Ig-like domain-containing protein [Arthrobacter deserti]
MHRIQARITNPEYSPEPPSGPSVPQYLTSPTLTFTVDTAGPAASVVAPFPSNPSLDNTPTFNFTANEPGAAFECQLLPSNAEWDPTCTAPTTYDAQSNGNSTFNVRATDVAGNTGAAASRSLRIGPADTIAPTVSTPEPASAGTEVGLGSNVSANFCEDVQGVTGETFTLKDAAGNPVAGTVTYDPSTGRATLDPAAGPAPGTGYTVTLTGGADAIRDTSEQPFATTTWSFTTAAVPSVTARTPGADATSVAIGSSVAATFSKDVEGLGATTFTLQDTAGTTIPAAVPYDAGTRTATLRPGADLTADTRYTATLTGGPAAIRAAADLPLESTSWSFPTDAAPVVSARTPAAGTMAGAGGSNITATFNEAVAGLVATTFTLKNAAGTAVPGTVSYNTTTNVVTLNPAADLAPHTRDTATLAGGPGAIRVSAATPLATTSWSFTTGAAPTMTAKSPGSNSLAVQQGSNITVTFSEAVQGVTASTFKITKASTGAAVSATVTRNGTTNQWILNPAASLPADTKYTVT